VVVRHDRGIHQPGAAEEIRHFAKQVLQGILGDSAAHFLVAFFAVEDDDEFDESVWPKANPLMGADPADQIEDTFLSEIDSRTYKNGLRTPGHGYPDAATHAQRNLPRPCRRAVPARPAPDQGRVAPHGGRIDAGLTPDADN